MTTRVLNLASHAASALYVLPLAFLLAATAHAQTGTATVRGTVPDPQGNAVAGAAVTHSNEAKKFSRVQVTSEEGGYSFVAVPQTPFNRYSSSLRLGVSPFLRLLRRAGDAGRQVAGRRCPAL